MDLAELPQKYFNLMNDGERYAKMRQFGEAFKCFSQATTEAYNISKFFLLRASKRYDDDKLIDDIALIIVWLLKIVKTEFFKELSEYNIKFNLGRDARNHLFIAEGVQRIGNHLISLLKDYIDEHKFKVHFAIHEMYDALKENLEGREKLLKKLIEES